MVTQPSYRVVKTDLHCHTQASYDSNTKYEDLIRRCKKEGIDKIAITDHDTIKGALKLKKLAPDLIIVGQEVRCLKGDIIGLFLTEEISKNLSLREAAKEIKKQGGLVYIPHLFDRLRSGIGRKGFEKIKDLVDIIEVFNGKTFWPSINKKAWKLAKKNKIIMAAGSDSHQVETIGKTFNELESFKTPQEFLLNLKNAKRTEHFLGFKAYFRSLIAILKSLIRKS